MIERISQSGKLSNAIRDMTDTISQSLLRQIDRYGEMMTDLVDTSEQLTQRFAPPGRRVGPAGVCDIPDPCWMPASLGERHCSICKGARGLLEITITNEDFRPRTFDVVAAGSDASHLTIQPGSFSLGPKERRVVTVAFDADDALKKGQDCDRFEALIWVLGCQNQYLRWIVDVGKGDHGCCIQLQVSDRPDYQHHWYDHFYCPRQCFGPATRPTRQKSKAKASGPE